MDKENSWVIKADDNNTKNNEIFDAYVQLCLVKQKAKPISIELDILEKERAAVSAKLWHKIELFLELGHDISLSLNVDESNADQIVIERSKKPKMSRKGFQAIQFDSPEQVEAFKKMVEDMGGEFD